MNAVALPPKKSHQSLNEGLLIGRASEELLDCDNGDFL
jgi:hypothetical protein